MTDHFGICSVARSKEAVLVSGVNSIFQTAGYVRFFAQRSQIATALPPLYSFPVDEM